MAQIKDDMEGGFNTFIQEQKNLPGAGEARVTLVQFDSEGIETVYESKLVKDVPRLILSPRGNTPLLDAVGQTVKQSERRLTGLKDTNVLVLVITDGHENASTAFTKQQVKELVQRMQDDHNWIFSYLGANVEAFAEAQGLGIPTMTSASYQPTGQSVNVMFSAVSAKTADLRSGKGYGHFTPQERDLLNNSGKTSPTTSSPTGGKRDAWGGNVDKT